MTPQQEAAALRNFAPARPLALAHRAKKRRPAGLHHAPDGALAARRGTAFAGAVVDAEIVLEIAELAVGAAVIAQRGAAGGDRVREHGPDGIDQPVRALVRRPGPARDRRCAPLGREPRAVERLADVNVAEPSHHLLVRQRGLERGLLALARTREHRGIELVAERLGTERAQERLALELGAGNELHHAEAT